MRARLLSIAVVTVLVAACSKSSSSSGSEEHAAAPHEPAATKAPAAATTAGTPATPSAKAEPAGAASVFAGAPDPDVKLAASASTRLANLWIQPPVGWSFVTDPTLGWQLQSQDAKAQLYLDEVPAGAALTPPADGLVPGYSLKGTKVGPVEKTTLGKFALPLQVSSGTSHIMNQPAEGKVFGFVIQTGDKKDVHGIALLRSGASADQEKALIASIRSIRRATDK